MDITWADAWQIAGEITDKLTEDGVELTMYQQERIASQIFEKNGQRWSNRDQEWQSV